MDLEVSGLNLIEALSRHFHGVPERNQDGTCPEKVSKLINILVSVIMSGIIGSTLCKLRTIYYAVLIKWQERL
jgi:hypothetical protein